MLVQKIEEVAKTLELSIEDVKDLISSGDLKTVGSSKKLIRQIDLETFITGGQNSTYSHIDTTLTNALPSTNLDFIEECIVSEEEFKMGTALCSNGSVYFNSTRQVWQGAFYLVDSGIKKRRIVSGHSEADVRAKMVMHTGRSSESIVSFTNKHLFTDCLDVALKMLKQDVSVATAQGYDDCAKYLYRDLKDVYIEDFKFKEVQNFCDNLRSFKDEMLSKSICHKIRIIMNRVFKYAINEEYIKTNPLEFAKFKHKKTKDTRDLAIDKETLRKIMIAVHDDKILSNIVVTLLKTGLRIGELLVLKYSDLDFENNAIKVDEAYKRLYKDQLDSMNDDQKKVIKSGKRFTTGDTKNSQSEREVVVDSELMSMFAEMRKLNAVKGFSDDRYIFAMKNGALRSYGGLRDRLSKAMKEHGLTNNNITFHRFRHSYITHMDSAGVDSTVRKALTGHLNGNVHDDVYTKISVERKAEAVRKYAEYMKEVFNI